MSDAFRELARRLPDEPELAAKLRAETDADVLARGLMREEIARLRDYLSPLRNFSWVLPGQLAGCALPRSPETIQALAAAGVRRLITLTEDPLPRAWLRQAGIADTHVPIPDYQAPTQDQLARVSATIDESVAADEPVAVHCAAGRGRTGTVLAAYFIHRGMPLDEAIAEIRRLRPSSVESNDQIEALRAYADDGAPP